jgi:hypothetical protein
MRLDRRGWLGRGEGDAAETTCSLSSTHNANQMTLGSQLLSKCFRQTTSGTQALRQLHRNTQPAGNSSCVYAMTGKLLATPSTMLVAIRAPQRVPQTNEPTWAAHPRCGKLRPSAGDPLGDAARPVHLRTQPMTWVLSQ